MKKFLAALATAFTLCACGPISGMLTDEEKAQYDQLIAEEAQLKAEIEVAAPEDRVALESKLGEVQVELAKIETGAVRRSFGPVWGTLTDLPVVGPYLKWAGPLAGLLAAPLLSKRGRKHYWSMVKNATPFVAGSDGSKGVSIMNAMLDAGRAFGMAHSSEASKTAANAA